MKTAKKNRIEEKIHKINEMVIDNHENGRVDPDELIHPDFIRGIEALDNLQEHDEISKEDMQELNDLYDKHKKIMEEGKDENNSS